MNNDLNRVKTVVTETLGSKDKEGKLRFDLIPPEVDLAYAEVLTLGLEKKGERNWEKGILYGDCIAAIKRHLNLFERGHMYNYDDGDLSHLKHALFWIAALVTFQERGKFELNDLPAYNFGAES